MSTESRQTEDPQLEHLVRMVIARSSCSTHGVLAGVRVVDAITYV